MCSLTPYKVVCHTFDEQADIISYSVCVLGLRNSRDVNLSG